MTTVERTMSSTSTKLTSRSSCSTVSTTRKQNRSHFAKYYSDLCHIQHSHPLSAVKQNLNQGILNFYCDRIKFEEWWSIINALSCDKTLHFVAIRLRHPQKQTIEAADTEQKAKAITKQPVVTTRFVLLWLSEAIKMCLSQSSTLTVLELEGLPLSGDYLECINSGLSETITLQHLSLSKCLVRDEGAELICHTIKNLPSIVSLDLSHCCLTERGAEIIAGLIKYQKLNRYSEAWKQTLRYRDPDVEAMPGLRRITINNNPNVGDNGINVLVEEIKDDLWLRALDVQDCGLTDEGGKLLLDLLENNSNLVIVDGRGNPYMHEEVLLKIMNQLAINNQNKNDTEYKWINKNPDLKAKKSQVAITRSRPWTCQSSTRFINKAPPPSECCSPMISRGFSHLKRSNTITSSGSLSRKNQKEASEKFKAKNDTISSENERLRLQLRDLTLILSQEVRHKLALIEENKNLKELIEKQESEKKNSLKSQNKKVLVDEDTLKVLEETLSNFGIFMDQKKKIEEQDTSESTTTRSAEEYETPEIALNQINSKNISNSTEKLNESFQKHKIRRSKSEIQQPLNLERKFPLDLHVGDVKESSIENHRVMREKKRGNHWLKKDEVIWEEEETSSNCDDLPANSETNLDKTRAQAMFMKILEERQKRDFNIKIVDNCSMDPDTPNSQDETSSNDFDYDARSNEKHQKPLLYSNEENSS